MLLGIFADLGALRVVRLRRRARRERARAVAAAPRRRSRCCCSAGAVGKSAQLPLHVWLPDAMAGPTPVSALIHAATMVTAGVYLVVRSHVLFEISDVALPSSLIVGFVSALYAALASIGQYDMKRALAYSTMSQLGFMFLAAGLGLLRRRDAAAGLPRVLQGAAVPDGGQRDARAPRRDRRAPAGRAAPRHAVYGGVFAAGALSLSGMPPFSGLLHEGHIIEFASHDGRTWPSCSASLGAFLSAWYIARPFFLTFFGRQRYEGHAHEAPPLMRAPLRRPRDRRVRRRRWLGLQAEGGRLATFLEPVARRRRAGDAGPSDDGAVPSPIVLTPRGVAHRVVALGLRPRRLGGVPRARARLPGWLGHAFYIDDLYAWVVRHRGPGSGGSCGRPTTGHRRRRQRRRPTSSVGRRGSRRLAAGIRARVRAVVPGRRGGAAPVRGSEGLTDALADARDRRAAGRDPGAAAVALIGDRHGARVGLAVIGSPACSGLVRHAGAFDPERRRLPARRAPVGRVGGAVVVRRRRRVLDLARHGDHVHVPDRDRRVVEGRATQVRLYMALALFLETVIIGSFLSLDLLLFFLFFEALLFPMYFIIGVWGSKRRIYAAEVPAVHDVSARRSCSSASCTSTSSPGSSSARRRSTSARWSSWRCRPTRSGGCSSRSSSASR